MSSLSDISEPQVCRPISSVEAITSQDDNNYRLLEGGSIMGFAQKDQKDRTTSVDVLKTRIKEYRKIERDNQTYEGTVFYNSIHGNGFYLINKDGANIFYDGLFYVNKLEGYGQVFYEQKGQHFQGLFKKNQWYGPGILSHSNLTADKGIWEGFFLIRLLTVVSSDIPTLATTSLGRARLLKYKYLIPTDLKRLNYTKQLLQELNIADPDGLKARSLLNSEVTHEDSLFFKRQAYDENFLENFFESIEKSTIEVLCLESGEEEAAVDEGADTDISISSKRNQSTQTNLRYLEINRKLAEFIPIYEQYAEQKENLLGRIEYCRHCCQTVEPEEKTEPHAEPNKETEEGRTSYMSQMSYDVFEKHNLAPCIKSKKRDRERDSRSRRHSEKISGFRSDGSSIGTGRYNTTPTFSDYHVSPVQSNQPTDQTETTMRVSYLIPSDDEEAMKEEICLCPEELHSNDVDLELLEDELREVEKHEWFYKAIIDSLSTKLIQGEKRDEKRRKYFNKTKNVHISELVSWNNESRMMDIQRHCFIHRHSENMLTFNVSEFLKGNRKSFNQPGEHEETCKIFLAACGRGHKDLIRETLTSDRINVNVTDGRGNSGILFAAVKNRLDVISILTNYGANLDQLNDEGLTALSVCVLKYLAIKNRVTDWEKAFLSELDFENTPNDIAKWYDIKSFLSLITQSSETCTKTQNDSLLENVSNHRLVELITKLSNSKIITNITQNTTENAYVFDLSYKNSSTLEKDKNPTKESSQNSLNKEIQDNLKEISLTIMTLIEYGADPNIGDVPCPVLMSALFTENPILVSRLLKSKADFTVKITKDNLSCLHVVALLPPSEQNIEICDALFAYHCDPNLKTNPEHWFDQISYIRGKIPDDIELENSGKSPLHLLCMRNDYDNDKINYFGKLARLIIENGVDLQDTYLGHTGLSLAVLVGNIQLAKFLIQENLVNPYQLLPYEMGNVLTLYTLKRYENILPIAKCKDMLDMLLELNVNFLNNVGSFENAIHFAEKSQNLISPETDNGEMVKSKKGKNKEKKKKAKPEKSLFLSTLRDYIKDLAKKIIIKYIQLKCVEILYDFSEEKMLEQDIAVSLAEFLTTKTVIGNLKLLLEHAKIEIDRFNIEVAKNMVEYVNIHQKVVKPKKVKNEPKVKKNPKPTKDAKKSKKLDKSEKIEPVETKTKDSTIDDILENLTRTLPIENKHFVTEFGLDDPQKYFVCFNCLKSLDKELKLCPKCQMVYFCSAQCNKHANKKKTMHGCNILFYENMGLNEIENSLVEIANTVKQRCLKRLFDKREDLRRQKQEELLQLWKADTYGTKFSQYKYILKKCSSDSHKMHIEDIQKISFVKILQSSSFFLETHDRLSSFSKCARIASTNESNIKKGISDISVVNKVGSKKVVQRRVKRNSCDCVEKKTSLETKNNEKQLQKDSKLTLKNIQFKDYTQKPTKFELINKDFDILTSRPAVKQLKKVPEKYHRFMEILSKYFPDIDLSSWFLPYACYSEGQLYYKFCDDLFRDSYSFL